MDLSAFADGSDPALGVFYLAPLDAGEGIVQLLGQRADLVAGDLIGHIVDVQFADGRNNRRRAAAKGLFQRAVCNGFLKLIYAQLALFHRYAPILEQLNAAAAGDAGRAIPLFR